MRPARAQDLDGLLALAAQTGSGLTTLPRDADLLARRIAASEMALEGSEDSPGDQNYLFVLATEQGQIAACSGLVGAVGTEQAFYNYHVGRTVFASRELEVYRSVPTLYLSNDLTGCSELATLFVSPAWRGQGVSRLVSRARFLFIAAHRRRFADRIIAELRGVADGEGHSPFWDSLGRHFFAMDFTRADRLSGAATRAFIAELMPKHPLYTVLLTPEARAAIGEVHPDTRGARHLLEQEGFRYRDYVDIFDAGPVLEADTDKVRSVARTRFVSVAAEPLTVPAATALVATPGLDAFRAIQAPARLVDDGLALRSQDSELLGVSAGDPVCWLPPERDGDPSSVS